MIVKLGNIVIHTGVNAWGAGKVVALAPCNATIQFSDGVTRKIAATHFNILEPASPGTFIPTAAIDLAAVKPMAARVKRPKLPKSA